MEYSDLKKCAESRKMQLNDVACHIGMTYQGFKSGVESGKLASDKVLELCKTLHLSPNAFYEWELYEPLDGSTPSLKALQEQLALKDQQIADLLAIIKNK